MPKYLTLAALLVLMLILCLNPAWPGLKTALDPVDPLYRSFLASEARLSEAQVEAWGRLKRPILNSQEMMGVLKKISRELAPGAALRVDGVKDKGQYLMTLEGEIDNRRYFSAMLKTMGLEGKPETYLVVKFSQKGSSAGLEAQRQKIKRTLQSLGAKDPYVAVHLQGELDRILSPAEKEELALEMMRTVAARKVEGITQPSLLSYSGYTPLIEDSLKVDSRKLNLNIALTDNEVLSKTIVRVGSPLLGGEY